MTEEIDTKKLLKERDEYLALCQRARADYANLKKEIEKEKNGFLKIARENFIILLLPIIDNFNEAVKHTQEVGILQIKKQLDDLIKNLGAAEFSEAGDKFDPNLHEAITGEGDKVVQVVKKGYKIKDRIIRAAQVVVGK